MSFKHLIALTAAVAGLTIALPAEAAVAIEGHWSTGDAVIAIGRCSNEHAAYCGTILSHDAEPGGQTAVGFVV